MSASHKKQLRKEQNAAQMTEKQQNEQAEAKKLRLYTIAFTTIIIVMVCFAVFTTVSNSGIIERNTTAVTVGDSKISAVELNYYYIDSINEYVNQWGDYISLSGIDTTAPLNEQIFNEGEGTTWADYFLDYATESIHSVYSSYNEAVAAGYTLSEEDAATIDSTIATMELYAVYAYGYSDLDSFLVGMYGHGANEETYRAYAEVQYIASAYANDYYESLNYTADEIEAVLAENPKAYTSYSYNYYYLSATDFLEGGTTGEDGSITYSDEEKDAAVAACKEVVDTLMAQDISSAVLFDKAVNNLEINADSETAVTSTAVEGRLYTELSATLQEWVTDDARQAGDVGCVPYETESTDTDGNTVTATSGYYVVLFNGSDDNTYLMNNVRHILVAFEGGTTDDEGNTVYSDEEKAAALAEAEEILAQYEAGEQTEEAFTALALENSDDVDSNGNVNNEGLYENIIPSSSYVENFLNWSIDDARTPGETGIVETEYGYHVMYFVGDSELSYRDYLITSALRNEDMTAWQEALIEASSMNVKNTGKVAMDLTLSSN